VTEWKGADYMKTIITIGRQYGSAGHSIGKILADGLGIKYYDKELLERAAKDSGLCQELFENHDEKPTNSFLYSLVMDSYAFGYGSTMMDMPLNQKVFLAQFDAIKKISQDGPCVIVGRCADYALEENPNVLSIFIKADMQDRIRRIAKLYDLYDEKAKVASRITTKVEVVDGKNVKTRVFKKSGNEVK